MGRMLTVRMGNHLRLQSIQQKPPTGERCWQSKGCSAEYHAGLFFILQKLTLVTRPGTVDSACLS
jgi:hypothetical protein